MTETQPPRKKRSLLKPILIGLLVLIVGAGALWAWQNRAISPVTLKADEKAVVAEKIEALSPAERDEPEYVPGEKEIHFTERELNGLLNEHTDLGEKVKLELATDAIHARIQTKLDPDFPIMGGKTLKARARVQVKMDEAGPSLILEDLTVWGVSLPNDWLAGLKGKNFLKEIFGNAQMSGVENVQVKNGEILIKLKD